MTPQQKVSCVIPSYNEEKRIQQVLDAVIAATLVDEIIVVDGSNDCTPKVVKQNSSVTLIEQHPNKGKAAAVRAGVEHARNTSVILLDADLHGLTNADVDRLALASLCHPHAWILGAASDPAGLSKMFGFDLLSGERGFSKEDFLRIQGLDHAHYALEVLMNEYIRKNKRESVIVQMFGVSYKFKSEKYSVLRAFFEEIKMTLSIYSTIGFLTTIRMYGWYLNESRKLRARNHL